MGSASAAVAVGARVVLAAALGFAALAKLRGFRTLSAALASFGIPARATRMASVALPLSELMLAVALLAWPRSPFPGIAALVLLAVFTALLLRAMSRRVPCPCFGGLGARPPGPAAVVRNGLLLADAVLATGSIEGARSGAAIAVALLAVPVVVAVRAGG